MLDKEELFSLIREQIYYSYSKPCDFNTVVRPVLEKIAKTPDGLAMLNKVSDKDSEIMNIYREISQLNKAGLDANDYDIIPYNKNFNNLESAVPTYNYENPIFVPQIQLKVKGIWKLLEAKEPRVVASIKTAYETRIKSPSLRSDYERKVAMFSDVYKMKEQQGEGKHNLYVLEHKDEMIDKRILKDLIKKCEVKDEFVKAVIFELDQSFMYKDTISNEIKLDYVDNQMSQKFFEDIQMTSNSIRKNRISIKKAKGFVNAR